MKSIPYFDKCADAVLEINRQDIAERVPGKEIGRGGHFYVRPMGAVVLSGTEVHLALKKGYTPIASTYIRLLSDLSVYAFLDSYAPEITDRLPAFVAGLSEQEQFETRAILTEDVSMGGTLGMCASRVRPSTLDYLTKALANFGKPEDIFDMEELDGTLAVRVGADGAEKFIDTDPCSFINIPRLDELFTQANELAEDGRFTVRVGQDSTLLHYI